MFIAALLIIAKFYKQPRCPTNDEWIKKMQCIYTLEYYSSVKKNEIMLLGGKWMELDIYICIYIHTHIYICIYIYIYRERERERENMIIIVGLSEGTRGRQVIEKEYKGGKYSFCMCEISQ
jgi:hypothetical protein